MARQHGQAAHSPELTAAAGWLAAVLVLGFVGDAMVLSLTDLVRGSFLQSVRLPDDVAALASHVRGSVMGLAWPLAAILAGFSGGAFAAHQFQVRGLWATSQLAPDLSRLWRFSKSPGLSALAVQSIWSSVKALVLIAAVAWALHAGWSNLVRQSDLEGPALARAAGQIVLQLSWALGGVLLALGLADYGLRYRRFEVMLRTTPEQQREDQRVVEGDPAARAQRQRVARSMRGDSPELLAGAALLLCGPAGLTLVIAGGPPPRRVSVRTIAKGGAGLRLRRTAEAAGLPHIENPSLAQRLAQRPAAGSAIAAELIADLAASWPAMSRS
jgi:flagellar biosynthetic protein FlhB